MDEVDKDAAVAQDMKSFREGGISALMCLRDAMHTRLKAVDGDVSATLEVEIFVEVIDGFIALINRELREAQSVGGAPESERTGG